MPFQLFFMHQYWLCTVQSWIFCVRKFVHCVLHQLQYLHQWIGMHCLQ